MAEYGYVVGWLEVREVGCGWDGKQLRVVGWESRWDGICRHTTNWQLMGCTNHSDGDGMVACDGNEIPRPIPSHPITIPFVMVIPSHRITTHNPEFNGAPRVWAEKKHFGHKILMKQPHDCSYWPMGGRPNGDLLKNTERKLKSSLGAPRITEQPRRHSTSARYIRDPMTQGYRPGGACRSCGTIPRKSSRSPGPFLVVSHYTICTTVLTLQIPPATYGPRTSSV